MRLHAFFSQKRKRRVPLDAIALLLLLNVSVGALASLYMLRFSARVREAKLEQLEAIATLKLSQLNAWRAERLQDAWAFFENTIMSRAILGFVGRPDSRARRAEVEPILEAVARRAQYESIMIIDNRGVPLLTFPPSAPRPGAIAMSIVTGMAGGKAPALSDPFLDTDGAIRLLAVAPLLEPSTGRVLGCVAIAMDPAAALYPLIAEWPIPSPTAEALIVRERDGRALYLSPLRFRSGAVLISLPATEKNSLVSNKAVRGFQGPTEGRDYRGELVYATVRGVSGLSWFLEIKVDRAEVNAEIRSGSLLGIIALTVVQLVLSALVIVRWSRQSARATAERERLRTRLTKARELESVALLAAGVAHDFNNSLASISGYAEVLKSRASEPALREYAEKILAATRRAAYVVHGLLSFSEQRQIRSETVELNGFLRGQRESLAAALGPRVSLRIETSTAEIMISADRDQLETVLRHLADNSREAMPNGGTFTVRTDLRVARSERGQADGRAEKGMHAGLVVSDTGGGIPPDMQERIFEPFYTTKGFGKSAGIGLAAVYGIVRQHGGSIEVESAPGKGATFTIRFPLLGQKETTNRTIAP